MLVVSALLAVDAQSEPYAYFVTDVSDKYGTALTTEHLISDDIQAWNGAFKNGVFTPSVCTMKDVPIVHRQDGAFVRHSGKYAWCIGMHLDNRVRLLSIYGRVLDIDYESALRIVMKDNICNVFTPNDERVICSSFQDLPTIQDTAECVWTGAFARVPKVGDVVAKDSYDVFGDPLVRAGDILTELQVEKLSNFFVLPPILDADGLSPESVSTLAYHSSRFYVDLGEASWLLQTVAAGKEVSMDMLRKGLPTIPTGGVAWVIRLSELDASVACHSLTVSQLVGCIAREVLKGKSEATVEKAMLGALLHDVGKLKVDPNVLEAGRKLSAEEIEAIKEHPRAGFELLNQSPSKMVRDVALTALRHHVKRDGRGYPNEVDLSSLRAIDLVVQFCDILSALLAKRQYKEAIPPMQALRIVCKEFEDLVVARIAYSCADALQTELVGASVQMQDGSYGVIMDITDRKPVGHTVVRLKDTGEIVVSDGTLATEPLRILGV